MEQTITIKLPEDQVEIHADNFKSLLFEVLNANSEKIGYLIQDYFARDKVRGVAFDLDQIQGEHDNFTARASFTLEQFSVCAAIDSIETSSMLMKVSITDQGNLIVAGEQVFE